MCTALQETLLKQTKDDILDSFSSVRHLRQKRRRRKEEGRKEEEEEGEGEEEEGVYCQR